MQTFGQFITPMSANMLLQAWTFVAGTPAAASRRCSSAGMHPNIRSVTQFHHTYECKHAAAGLDIRFRRTSSSQPPLQLCTHAYSHPVSSTHI
jgi:hypothetical protein